MDGTPGDEGFEIAQGLEGDGAAFERESRPDGAIQRPLSVFLPGAGTGGSQMKETTHGAIPQKRAQPFCEVQRVGGGGPFIADGLERIALVGALEDLVEEAGAVGTEDPGDAGGKVLR